VSAFVAGLTDEYQAYCSNAIKQAALASTLLFGFLRRRCFLFLLLHC
jgi:hypothetical protein